MRQIFTLGALVLVLLGATARATQADEAVPTKMLHYQHMIEDGEINPAQVKRICGKIKKHRNENFAGLHDERCAQVSDALGLDAGDDCQRLRHEFLTNWRTYLQTKFREDCDGLPEK